MAQICNTNIVAQICNGLRLAGIAGLLLVVSTPSWGQIYPGGGIGYPGGGIGFPGGGGGVGFPGGGRRRNPNADMPTQNFLGILNQISNSQLSMTTDDKTSVTVMLSRGTTYVKESGSNGKNSDFSTGDRISVDANQDNNGNYRATRVTQVHVGSTQDKAGASGNSTTTSSSAPPGDDDPDRPRLHRADSNVSSNAPDNSNNRASSSNSSPPPSSSTASTRPSAPASSNTSGSTAGTLAPPPDPDDGGPPVLRRGRPAQTASQTTADPDAQIATGRPSIHAEEVNGVTQAPPPPRVDSGARPSNGGFTSLPRNSGDPVVEQAREAVFSFSETLPNYVVKQNTTRYATETAAGGKTSWQALDNVTADIIMENGVERYKNILVNGKAPHDAIEKTGSWSSGEFSSLLQDVFSTPTNAEFHGKRTTSIANRAAYRYDFSVEQPNSHWHVEASNQSFLPAYTGTVWIDKETSRVLRIEMASESMPKTFPLDTVESAVDYDFVLIGDSKYLLPVHSESLSCERGTRQCSRNVIDFRNYRKFSAESSITFDPNE
jgi:hypothetical protein